MKNNNKALNFSDDKKFKKMVGWFDVTVLIDAAKRAVLSSLFGEYADKRLIHAALEDVECLRNVNEDESQKFDLDVRDKIGKSEEDGIWIDYVADLGDGFDSTYAIANLIGRKELKFDGMEPLPRADILIMGGDQIYPTPTREDYECRLEMPYDFACPDSEPKEKVDKKPHPLLFMIPGNHDWYDGLTLFLAKFCRGAKEGDSFANWRMYQNRSYFAIRISKDWWIWGMDTQLGEDVDMPQAAYFEAVAKKMEPNSKIILCASVPTWLKADYEEEHHQKAFGRGINFFAENIICNNCKGPTKIYAVISGDQHHYSRYMDKENSVNFITAGGGGAFLHPTHHLRDNIKNIYWQGKSTPLKLCSKNGTRNEDDKACFPARETSREMAKGNLKFPLINKQFAWTLGGAYVLMAWLITWTLNDVSASFIDGIILILKNPITLIVFITFISALRLYADYSQNPHGFKKVLSFFKIPSKFLEKKLIAGLFSNKTFAGLYHASTHMFLLLVSISALLSFGLFDDVHVNSYTFFIIYLPIIGAIGGFLGGLIWGVYLYISSYKYDRHYNDAFSSMRIADYKNFLRMHIKGDELKVYPVGIEKVPERNEWVENPNYKEFNPDEPRVVSKKEIDYKFIEDPFSIK